MDLAQIAGPAHYLPGRVNIGALIGDGQAALIDTGLDEGAARKAVQAVEPAGLRVAAVINTHAHADHCGGNAFVVKRTGAPIYAPPVEAALIQHTAFEPFFLFGASPFEAIDSKWFHAAPPEALSVPPMDPAAYLLNAAAVKAHLSALVREGRAAFEIQDQPPLWRRLA